MKGAVTRFVISDDLFLFLASIASSVSLLNHFGIEDASMLDEMSVNIVRDEVSPSYSNFCAFPELFFRVICDWRVYWLVHHVILCIIFHKWI